MEAKFSDNVKESISLSREEAIRLSNDFIGLEHMILGMIRNGDNSAIDALKRKNIHIDNLKFELENAIANNYDKIVNQTGSFPLSKECELMLKTTYLEGKLYKSDIIRCVHLLSSILRNEETLSSKILNKLGINYLGLQNIILDYAIGTGINESREDSIKVEKQLVRILDSALIQVSDHFEPAIGIRDIANEMAKLISNLKTTERGKMVGIFGNWGRGKTFLMNLIWSELTYMDSKFNRIDFHAWKYQDTPAIWAYLYEAISEGYYKPKYSNWLFNRIDRIVKIIKLNFFRNGIYNALIFIAVCTSITITGHELFSSKPFLFSEGGKDFKGLKIAGFVIPLTVGFVTWIQNVMKNSYSSAISLFKKYYENKNYSSLLGVQFEIQKEIKHLLRAWFSGKNEKGKIFLIVDDIDRCNEDKVIQIIDSLRIMLDYDELAKRIVILSAIDERILKLAVRKKYFDFIDKDFKLKNKMNESDAASKQMITEYLDKLFISGIKLRKLSSNDKKEFFSLFTKDQLTSKQRATQKTDEQKNIEKFPYDNQFESYAENLATLLQKGSTNADAIEVTINGQKRIINVNDTNEHNKPMLQAEEYSFIHEMIGSLDIEMTPRQIRIFYFRYLLARNLLYKKHSVFSSQDELQSVRSLLSTILIASCFECDSKVEDERLRILASNAEQETILILNSYFILQRDIILNIYNVCEMVIGY